MVRNLLLIILIFVLLFCLFYNKNQIKEGLESCPLPEKSCKEKGYTDRFCSLRPENIIGSDGCFCDEEGVKGLLGRILPENNCKCTCWPGIV